MRSRDIDLKGLGRVVRGRISSSGGIISGTGFTVVRSAAGTYVIMFPPFKAPPNVEVTNEGGVGWGISGSSTSASQLSVWTYVSSTGTSSDQTFSFEVKEAIPA